MQLGDSAPMVFKAVGSSNHTFLQFSYPVAKLYVSAKNSAKVWLFHEDLFFMVPLTNFKFPGQDSK